MKIFVTGGAGYIGSHTVIELLNAGHEVTVYDNLSNSNEESLRRVEKITGKTINFIKGDIRDEKSLDLAFDTDEFDAVIHFAGLKAVGESVEKPLLYYDNNVTGTLTLVDVMQKHNVKKIVFSSSATVYGNPKVIPMNEECEVGGTTNPYGTSKYMIERILSDIANSDKDMSVSLLRYFNPIGVHESGLIGEDPKGIPNNLMPYITQVASGKRECLSVFGNDYDTPDGTGVRDYIHVCDLAMGHVKALDFIKDKKGVFVHNLGTGKGTSVLELVNAFEKENGIKINYKIAPRRDGDIATCYADTKKAESELGFKTRFTINDMVRDSWNWQKNNPNGYE